MQTLTNPKPITDVVETMPMLQQRLNETTEAMTLYLKYLKDEKFERKENESNEEALLRLEGIMDRIEEIVERRKNLVEMSQDVSKRIDEMKEKMEAIKKQCEEDEVNQCDATMEMIDQIVEIRRAMMEEKIAPHQAKINEYKQEFEDNTMMLMENREKWNGVKQAWLQKKSEEQEREQEERERKEREEKLKSMMLDEEECHQLEEWTSMKCGDVVFDSNVDDWNVDTSVFDDRVMNRSNLIVVIEDEDNNKFGVYINAQTTTIGSWKTDDKAFVFSLKSNGRINGMRKFKIKSGSRGNAFVLYNSSNDYLFAFGSGWFSDVCVYKQNRKISSYCNQLSYDYENIGTGLCGQNIGQTYFTPNRFTVIQMI